MSRGKARNIIISFIVLFACAVSIPAILCAQAPTTTARVAVLPFSMHTPADLAYLQNGVRDMLTSRLAWQGKVEVIDRTVTEQALPKGSKSDISLAEAVRVGSSVKADYVLFGSITALGQSISIDAKMAPVSGNGEPLSLATQAKMDDVIPQINKFAQQINQKVFARPGEQAQEAAASEAETLATRNPELLVPGSMIAGDKISYLNPNFIEVTPEGTARQGGVWRSQTFQGPIIGMDIGDFDGDGHQELVALNYDKLSIYRKEYQGLKLIATYNAMNVDHFVWVCAADPTHEGRDKIYVSNIRKQNTTKSSQTESAQGNMGYTQGMSSFVLALDGSKLRVVADKIPYFLNTVTLGKRGKVLVGQQKGATDSGAFKGSIFEMALRGNALNPTTPVNVPERCNVFNFARVDINGDNMDETLVIDENNHLLVLNSAGDVLVKKGEIFAATTNTFEALVHDRRFNQVDIYGIPSPILITDINKDGSPEIVLNRNTTPLDKWLPDDMKTWDKGEIVSLSWDQMGLLENWKTREIGGMVTSIRIGDINNDGNPQLIGSMVLAKDLLKIWDSKSTIFSYSLNVGAAPKTDKK